MAHPFKSHKIYPHIFQGRFYNHPGERKPHFLWPSIRMLIESHLNKNRGEKPSISNWLDSIEPILRSSELAITWIGHSTFLIQIAGINILTDPIFGNLSPLYYRILPPGIPLAQLPPIDYVILSHNHYDHMDRATLLNLKRDHKNITFLVPQGDKKWFNRRGFEAVTEHMWWDTKLFKIGKDLAIEFIFLPAKHWSQRGLFDYNKSLWGSWMIRCNGLNLYFAGDTADGLHFKNIAQEFNQIDLAIMPIGPCEPRNWMYKSHLSAEEAGNAFITLGATHFIPMHWGTYYFGNDHFTLPYDRLVSWWNSQQLSKDKLHVLKVGQRKIFQEYTFTQAYQQKSILELL